jgi:hypothetical protein
MIRPCSGPARSRDRRRALTSRMPAAAEVASRLGVAVGLNYPSGGIYVDEAMAEPDLGKGTTYENRRRVPLRLHQGRRRSGPGEDHGLPLNGLPGRHRLRLPRQCSRSRCDLSHNGPAGDIPQDHCRERQSTPAGILSALRLADLFDLAGGGAAGVLHGTGGNLAPAP